jgi:hypothetical protein
VIVHQAFAKKKKVVEGTVVPPKYPPSNQCSHEDSFRHRQRARLRKEHAIVSAEQFRNRESHHPGNTGTISAQTGRYEKQVSIPRARQEE